MDFLQLILNQMEQYLDRSLTEEEKETVTRRVKDQIRAIELFITGVAKTQVEKLRDIGH